MGRWVGGLVGFGWAGRRAGGCMDGWMYRGGMMGGLMVGQVRGLAGRQTD